METKSETLVVQDTYKWPGVRLTLFTNGTHEITWAASGIADSLMAAEFISYLERAIALTK